MSRALKLAGGGILVAACIVFAAIALEPNEPVEINLNRDICVSEAFDRLTGFEAYGRLQPSPRTAERKWEGKEKEYWDELKKLISEYPSQATGTDYIFGTGLSFRMNLVPYRGMATGIICEATDLSVCRNRNFWFFKRIPPRQLAKIVFENTIVKEIPIRKCPF